jgi:hypothetical protein
MSEFGGGDATVNVPMAGRVKKRYLMIPAGAALAFVAYRWYQSRQDAASADASTSDGTYSTPDLTDYGQSTTGGQTTVTGNTGNVVTDGTNGLATNADWTNKAIELLTNQGYDGATVAAALGDFLAHLTLTKAEATIARAALAVAGQPPVGGPYSVKEEATTGGSGTLAAPGHLRAWDKTTDTQVGMQWDQVHGAAHYRIYRSDLGDEPIGDSLDTMFRAQGLTPNHTYHFYVRAMSTTGKLGSKSSTLTAKTAGVKLTAPTGLHASAITRSSFRVSCSAVKGATYYRWQFADSSGNWRDSGASDQPYHDFTGLNPNHSYRVRVQADTTNQTPGPLSAPVTVKTKK